MDFSKQNVMAIFISFFVLHPYSHDALWKEGEKCMKLKEQQKNSILCEQIELCIKYEKKDRKRGNRGVSYVRFKRRIFLLHIDRFFFGRRKCPFAKREKWYWMILLVVVVVLVMCINTGSVSHMDERKMGKNGSESERLSQRDNDWEKKSNTKPHNEL